jgi:hypothetical protein
VKLNKGQKGDSFSSSKDMVEPEAAACAAASAAAPELQPTGTHTSGTPDSATRQQLTGSGGLMPASHRHDSSAAHGSGGVHGSGGAIQWADSGDVPAGHGSGGVQGTGGARGSGGTLGYDVSTFSTAQHSQQFPTGASRSSRSTGMDERFSSVSALLKARSDVAVLRDLKIGPLLGRGSYGRVYRGESNFGLTLKCVGLVGCHVNVMLGTETLSEGFMYSTVGLAKAGPSLNHSCGTRFIQFHQCWEDHSFC